MDYYTSESMIDDQDEWVLSRYHSRYILATSELWGSDDCICKGQKAYVSMLEGSGGLSACFGSLQGGRYFTAVPISILRGSRSCVIPVSPLPWLFSGIPPGASTVEMVYVM